MTEVKFICSLRLALYFCQLYLSITFNCAHFVVVYFLQQSNGKILLGFCHGNLRDMGWPRKLRHHYCVTLIKPHTLVIKTRYLQQPIDSDDECDISGGKAHCREHYHHGYQSSIWNTRCTNTGDCCRDTTE